MTTATADRPGTTTTGTAPTERATAVGVFHSHSEAQKAVSDLRAAGFDDDQIGVASRDQDGTYKEQTEGNKAGEGAAVGAATGLGAGALWGLGIVAGALPAVGPVIAGGALAAVAASAAGTAAAGGLVGALIGLGIPEHEAEYYHSEFERGRTIVTVKCGERHYAKAQAIFDDANAYDFDRRESDYANDPTTKRVNREGVLVERRDVGADHRHATGV